MINQLFWNKSQSYSQAQRVLEHYLPAQSSGYIRLLVPEDSPHPYYTLGFYGFFNSDGDLLASCSAEKFLVRQATYEGFTIHAYN